MARPAKYPEQFRRDAVELVESSGRPIAEAGRRGPAASGRPPAHDQQVVRLVPTR